MIKAGWTGMPFTMSMVCASVPATSGLASLLKPM
jgi:hypothetical protein